MLAAVVVGAVFAGVFVITWLSSRADAAQSRCEDHLRHIQHHLEIPPTSAQRATPTDRSDHRPRG